MKVVSVPQRAPFKGLEVDTRQRGYAGATDRGHMAASINNRSLYPKVTHT